MQRTKLAEIVFLSGMMMFCTYAQTITFEPDSGGYLPDGSLAKDDMVISNQFLRSGVSFGFDNDLDGFPDSNGSPLLEKAGDDANDAFYVTSVSAGNQMDFADKGTAAQLGQYFLRTVSVGEGNQQQTLLISYVYPVKKASGEIWDLDANNDGYEQWRIEALDANQQVITNTYTPAGLHFDDPDSLDGLPWSFDVNADEDQDISALRLVYIGTLTNISGLAFNNFSPAEGLGTTNVIGVAKIAPAVEIYWHSQIGKTYQLQWTQGLGGNWHNLGASVEGTGTEMSVTDPSRGAIESKRMYRVLETQ